MHKNEKVPTCVLLQNETRVTFEEFVKSCTDNFDFLQDTVEKTKELIFSGKLNGYSGPQPKDQEKTYFEEEKKTPNSLKSLKSIDQKNNYNMNSVPTAKIMNFEKLKNSEGPLKKTYEHEEFNIPPVKFEKPEKFSSSSNNHENFRSAPDPLKALHSMNNYQVNNYPLPKQLMIPSNYSDNVKTFKLQYSPQNLKEKSHNQTKEKLSNFISGYNSGLANPSHIIPYKVPNFEKSSSDLDSSTSKDHNLMFSKFKDPFSSKKDRDSLANLDNLPENKSVYRDLQPNSNRSLAKKDMEVRDALSRMRVISNESYGSQSDEELTYEQLVELDHNLYDRGNGFNTKVLRNLKIEKYAQNDENICAICQSPFVKNEKISVLKCAHFYHHLCIKDWLLRKKRCPMACELSLEDFNS